MDVEVVVQTVAGRENVLRKTRRSIENSDIGADYQVLLQPPDATAREHFLGILDRMQTASSELVLRLEDDALVNRHILHNVRTWRAPADKRFGAGWMFGSWHLLRKNPLDIIYNRRPDIWVTGSHASVGVLLRTRDVEWIRAGCERYFAETPGPLAQDMALSDAVFKAGKMICVHNPPLVEHRLDVPSSLGHPHNALDHSTRGLFDPAWKRKAA